MKSMYSIGAAQAAFPAVVRAAQAGRLVAVSKHQETVAYVISRDRLESLVESLELLADPKFVRAWRADQSGKGKLHPLSALVD